MNKLDPGHWIGFSMLIGVILVMAIKACAS